MKSAAILLCTTLSFVSSSYGQDASSAEAALAPPAMPEASEQHKKLHRDVGEWDAEMTIWMGGPDADPIKMPAKETNVLLDGGFWILSEFEAGPFKGRGQFGYDPIKKKYVGTWIDNSSPFVSVMRGDFDDQGRLVMYFVGHNAQTMAEEKMQSRTVFTSDDVRHFIMSKKDEESGKWVKVFRIDYTRK